MDPALPTTAVPTWELSSTGASVGADGSTVNLGAIAMLVIAWFEAMAGRGPSMDCTVILHECGARRWRAIIAVTIAAAALVGLLAVWLARETMSPCESEVRFGDGWHGAEICLESYQQYKRPHDRLWAAKGYVSAGDLDEAERLTNELLSGPLFGDAHSILSYIELRRSDIGAARAHATIAYVVHTFAGDRSSCVSDAVLLSQVACNAGDFTAALHAADEALRLVARQRDPAREFAAHLARSDALRRMGALHEATGALTSAIERATRPCDQAWAHFKNGMLQSELQQEGAAIRELKAASRANDRCKSQDIAVSVAINLAWLRRWNDPAASRADLDKVTSVEGEMMETLLLRGYLAADAGELEAANDDLVRAENVRESDADWLWRIADARAELAERVGGGLSDLVAETHYRRAIAQVAGLRAAVRTRSAHFVASHRAAYDGLIELLARQARWRDVLAVILDLDASDMLRATADDRVIRDLGSPEIDPPPHPPSTSPTVDEVVSAWRSRDLVIVIAPSSREIGPGHERAYRLRVADGRVTGEDVGDANTAQTWARELFLDPANPEAARALGRMIVPRGSAGGTLHVLGIGALGKVPLAALRDDTGALSIATRPVVRVLGLRASGPESAGTRGPIVLADPTGDLPSAALEASAAAEALGSGAQVFAAKTATRERLWSARDAALLHLAVHVGERGRWRALRLADGEVDPSELVEHRLAPRIAVIAGCGSAAAFDEEGWGSIASALLESGTAVVIATDRSVGDDDALQLMREFYAQRDWRTDPARALARVQHALSTPAGTVDATRLRSWAAFSVLARPPVIPGGPGGPGGSDPPAVRDPPSP